MRAAMQSIAVAKPLPNCYNSPMTKFEIIEQDIATFDPADIRKLTDYQTDLWDRQIEVDAKAGKLDTLAQQALADHNAGLTRPP
jgi:hypothetical protein